jgi:methionyl aminopeptidase
MNITIKSKEEIEIMKKAGKEMARIMDEIGKLVKPGVDTMTLDKLAEELVFRFGGKPAFKGFNSGEVNPYPATICASINDEVVHGIPAKNVILKNGDLLKIDIGMEYQNFFIDMARTFPVGNINSEAKKIMEVTEQSFWQGLKVLKPGVKLMEYSKVVENHVKKNGFSVVRNLVGHGVGRALHEDPQVPNYYDYRMPNPRLKAGMTLALEPMVNVGTHETYIGKDGWVFKTQDGKLSAHYENTVLIKDGGVEVLTIK